MEFLLFLLRACDAAKFFNHMMKDLGKFRICCPVIHFFPFPSAYDQSAVFQESQMMGDSRACHIDNGRDIQYTFLAVAEKPEDAQTAWITQLLQCFGYPGYFILPREKGPYDINILSVVVRKILFIHDSLLHSEILFAQTGKPPVKLLTYYIIGSRL